jgi:ferredoxin
MGAGTGATQSKYVARRETPVYIAENCTQCMECITACPDTALPNTAQDVGTVLPSRRQQLRLRPRRAQSCCSPNSRPSRQRARARMNEAVKRSEKRALQGHHPRRGRPRSPTSSRRPEGRVPPSSTAPRRLRQRPGDLPQPREEESRRPAACSRSSSRPVQRLRRMRAGLRRSRRPAHDARDRGAERRASPPRRSSRACCRTPRRSSSASTTTARPRLPRGRPAQSPHGPPQLRGARLRRRRLRRLRREEHPRAAASVTEAYMRPLYHRQGRPPPRKGRPPGKGRLERLAAPGPTTPGIQPLPPGRRPRLLGLGGENDEDTRPHRRHGSTDLRRGHRRRHRRRCCARTPSTTNELQAIDGRARQRHVRHVHGRQHRLQHRLWLHPALEPASLSLDEFPLPGRPTIGWLLGESLILTTPAGPSRPSGSPTPCSTRATPTPARRFPADYFTSPTSTTP